MNQNKTYRVNDIFYTLQGEGFFTGVASVFIRLADCNLNCSFCDTEFSSSMEMGLDDISETIGQYKAKHIVLTGGEPTLQADKDLIDMLHEEGCFVQIETNGTNPLPEGVDWVTLSPKTDKLALTSCDELKVIYQEQPLEQYFKIKALLLAALLVRRCKPRRRDNVENSEGVHERSPLEAFIANPKLYRNKIIKPAFLKVTKRMRVEAT